MDPCCEMLRLQLDHDCELCALNGCPDQLVVVIGGRPALAIHDGGASGILIQFCPWCAHDYGPIDLDDEEEGDVDGDWGVHCPAPRDLSGPAAHAPR